MKKIIAILLMFISAKCFSQNNFMQKNTFYDSVYFKVVPYNSGAGIVHLGIDTVVGSLTFGKLVRNTAGGSGETNTGSNLGGGLDNYSTKVGVDLRFNSFAAADFDLGSNLITIDATKWLTISAAAAAYQPLDADLTSWAGVTRAAGIDTWIATPSSANLKTAITDETGTGGALVFATSPTLTTPIIADLGFISDPNGNELLIFDNVASAVNEITITTAAAGGTPVISASGEINANLGFRAKGTGSFLFAATADKQASFNIYEDTDNGGDFITLTVPASISAGGTATLPDASTKLPIYTQHITYTGPSTARTVTYPDANFTAARIDAAQTFTGSQTFASEIVSNTAVTASGNAATVAVTASLTTVTNNSAATLTITLTTASAVDGQISTVRVLDFSAAAQTITWVNTENSSVVAPTTSNGSTTLFLTVRFIYNSATSKWRCIGYA